MSRRPRLLLGAILFGYLVVALTYGVVNPLFEAPDEHHHFFTARYIAATGRLPSIAPETPDPWLRQEAAQPPLYYLLGAALIAPIDLTDAEATVWPNPFVRLGDASAPTNRNAFVHGEWETWPWRGYALAAHLLRGLSTLFGLGTLLLIYGSGRLLWPDSARPALLATALVAFLPQYLFLHAAVTNDVAVTFFSTATLYLLIRLWRRPVTTRLLLLTGAVAGVALLSKMAGLLAILYAAGFVAFLTWREKAWRVDEALVPLVTRVGMLLLAAGAVGGWLLVRNWLLYGDVTATSQFTRLEGSRDATIFTVIAELPGIWTSFIGVFGWFNVRAPQPVYWLWNGVALLGIGGAGWRIGQKQIRYPYLPQLLAGWVFLVALGLVSFMLRTPAAQGRLLFPALLPLALGLGWGLSALPRPAGAAAALLAVGAALVVPARTVPQAYAPPPLIAAGEIPESAARLDQPLGQDLTLVAAAVDSDPVRRDGAVNLTLYWQRTADRPVARADVPELVVEILIRDDFDGEPFLLGKLQSYHGGGLYPANLWPVGGVVAEQLAIPLLPIDADLPQAARVQVRLAEGDGVATAGLAKLVPDRWMETAADPALARLGDGIELRSARPRPEVVAPGEEVRVTVMWRVTQAPGRALTVFAHLGPAGAPPLATGDAVPRSGTYPTTFWAPGEAFFDGYTIPIPADMPPGTYPLWLGMYDAQGRLPLTIDGRRQPNDAYFVGEIEVVAP